MEINGRILTDEEMALVIEALAEADAALTRAAAELDKIIGTGGQNG